MALRLRRRGRPAEVEESRNEGPFTVGARAVAYWFIGLSFAAVAGLVVSLVTDDGSDLATVALILAIVAFGLQIVFFVGQLWVAGEQDRRSGQLYSETASLLAQIDASTTQTVEIIKEQFRFVLEHALAVRATTDPSVGKPSGNPRSDVSTSSEDGTVIEEPSDAESGAESESSTGADISPGPEAPAEGASNPAATAEIAQLVDRMDSLQAKLEGRTPDDLVHAWDQIGTTGHMPTATSWATLFDRQNKAQLQKEVRTWPGSEIGSKALEALKGLSPEALTAFKALVRRWRGAADDGKTYSGYVVNYPAAVSKELQSAPLVEVYRTRSKDGKLKDAMRFTDLGKAAAQLFTAIGNLPDWIDEPAAADLDALGPLNEAAGS